MILRLHDGILLLFFFLLMYQFGMDIKMSRKHNSDSKKINPIYIFIFDCHKNHSRILLLFLWGFLKLEIPRFI